MYDVILIGSGMGSLSAAALLSQKGLNVLIIEQNWIPGGCTTSYWRKGFVFEAGATTIVGMDKGMPLRYLLDKTGIQIAMRRLELPMQVHLRNGKIIHRHHDISNWIEEAKTHFSGDQKGFWTQAYEISQFVWQASTKYRSFPPTSARDLAGLMKNFSFSDIPYTRYALISTYDMMKKYGVDSPDFIDFVDEQMMITAQNTHKDVNFLFGSAALCYTNYQNYYVDGGMINLVSPIIDFIKKNNGHIVYKTPVKSIRKENDRYEVKTANASYQAKKIVAGIPINNLKEILESKHPLHRSTQIMDSNSLYSAFQLGIGFRTSKKQTVIHHQIHLDQPLVGTGSRSIFVSLNHPADDSRSDVEGMSVASVTTHIPDPEKNIIDDAKLTEEILGELEKHGFLTQSAIEYLHSSGPKSWKKWTSRKWGFVGGYPQSMRIKPWQMNNARLDGHGLYLAGDTAYPGQGIPGACLSGIIAAEKLLGDA